MQIGSLIFSLFPLVHLAVGIGLLTYAYRTRERRKRVYVHGVAATATIDRTGYDARVRINGRNPYEIGWTFFIRDQPFHGKRSSMNSALTNFREGDRIWILYDSSYPTRNVEYPPL